MFRLTTVIVLFCCYLTACGHGSASVPVETDRAEVSSKEISEDLVRKAANLEARGEVSKSLQFWRLAVALDPANVEANTGSVRLATYISKQQQYYLQEARRRTGNREFDDGIAYYLSALALAPDNQQIASELLEAERRRTLNSLANEPRKIDLKESVDSDAGSTEEKFELALTLISTDQERARVLLEEVLKQDPGHLGARAYLEVLAN